MSCAGRVFPVVKRSASVAAMPVHNDPLAPLLDLPGVAEASGEAAEALARAHRHKANRRGWPRNAGEASLRAARASAVLDGAGQHLEVTGRDGAAPDPILAGSLRVAQAMQGGDGGAGGATAIVGTWRRAPLQALARLHALAAVDLVEDDRLGRPSGDAGVGHRLELLAGLVTGGTRVPAPVLAGVVHGELMTLAPFGVADGVVARAASRLVTIVSGLDPHGLGVPEVHWMRNSAEYRAAARGFAAGTPDGLTAWLALNCRALQAGAREALQIASAASS